MRPTLTNAAMTIAFESREPCARGCIADLAFVTGWLLYHELQSKLSGKSLDQEAGP
jgi:hypothetical protein